jgi:hypothetical protein
MPTKSGADLFDALFYITAGGIAVMFAGFAFVTAIEAWRRWSTNRRIRRHLSH